MHIAVFVPLLASAGVPALLFPLLAGLWADHLAPRVVAWTLTLCSVALGLAWVGALVLLGASAVAQTAVVARDGNWPSGPLEAVMPWARPVGLCAGGLLLVSGTRVVRTARTLLAEYRGAGGTDGRPVEGMLIVEDPRPFAYARPVAGTRGAVVTSSGMLEALSTDEVRALMAHEAAHLRGRHHLFLVTTALALALNPLLTPVRTDLVQALERWADEDAASELENRILVARAIGHAALATRSSGARLPALGATSGRVPRRVAVLLGRAGGPSRRSRTVAAAVLVLSAVTVVAMTHAALDFGEMVALARLGISGD